MGVKVREKVKGSGEWWLFIDHNGKRKAKKVGRDKRTAMEAAKQIEAKLVLGDVGILDKTEQNFVPTFREYVYGWVDFEGSHSGWFHTFAQLSLKSSTRRGYKFALQNHLIPEFGPKKLNEISSRHISAFIYTLFGKGLRSQTIKNIKHCMSAILRQASDSDQYIDSNPARGVSIPSPEDEKPARTPCPFTWQERDHFENIFKTFFPEYHPIVICGFRTGLRIGEIIGLKWTDIDFHNRQVYVRRNATRGKITTPKSPSSKRLVRMTNQLIEVFQIHRKRCLEKVLKNGWKELPEWVFQNSQGGLMNYDNFLNRVWNKAVTKSGLSRRTPHDMRHTYATLRLSKGDSLAEVSKEMGHRSPDITYKTYYKWLPKESRSNIDELDGNWTEDTTIRNLSATK